MSSTIWSLETAKKKHRRSAALAALLIDFLPRDQPVLDLGCGGGFYLNALAAVGYSCRGVEGTPNIREIAEFDGIETADLSRPLRLDWPRSSVLCLEVGEHLLPEAEATLLDTIDRYCSGLLVLSWAIPGQHGHGHINCRSNSHVYRRCRERGFELLPEQTFLFREGVEEHVKYFRNTLQVFQRSGPHSSVPGGHASSAIRSAT